MEAKKKGRGTARIKMVYDIKLDDTYEKIKHRYIDRECWRN